MTSKGRPAEIVMKPIGIQSARDNRETTNAQILVRRSHAEKARVVSPISMFVDIGLRCWCDETICPCGQVRYTDLHLNCVRP